MQDHVINTRATALQVKQEDPSWNDIGVGVSHDETCRSGRWRRLRRIVRIAAGFLFSETECERNFAVDVAI